MKLSILISSYKRLWALKRCLYSIEKNQPNVPFEVVVADELSDESGAILEELRKRNFRWTYISWDLKEFEIATGYKKFWNCPAVTNNVAFAHSKGELVAQIGNDIIVWRNAFDELIEGLPKVDYAWSLSYTLDLSRWVVDQLDEYGENLSQEHLDSCVNRVLSNDNNVPNYLSVFTRRVWEAVGGYNEMYISGIGAEDSDFCRRAACLLNFQRSKWHGISLHQNHGGVSHLQRPDPSVITEDRLRHGAAINRVLYHNWNGKIENSQGWPIGTYGVKEVIRSGN